MFVADVGEAVGLGHVSRSSGIAVALRSRGLDVLCLASGATEPFERDGIRWSPLLGDEPPASNGILVVDSYDLDADELAAAAGPAHLVVLHDQGTAPRTAALVVAASSDPAEGEVGGLAGLSYAALRPAYWGLPARVPRERVQSVVVTTGGGRFGELGGDVARSIARTFPEVEVALIRGPHATFAVPSGVELIDAPDSLLEPLLASDLVVSAAGQTMLEAAACGTPCIALPLVENQVGQADQLAARGAVRMVSPFDIDDLLAAVRELLLDVEARQALSRNAQAAVDGYGALRVAFHVARLLRDSPPGPGGFGE